MNFRYIISCIAFISGNVRHPWRTSRTCAASGAGSRAKRASWKRGMAKHGSSVAKQWVSRKTHRKPMGWWWPTKLLWVGSSHIACECARDHRTEANGFLKSTWEGALMSREFVSKVGSTSGYDFSDRSSFTAMDLPKCLIWLDLTVSCGEFVDDFSLNLMSRQCWQVGRAQQSAPAILWSQKTIQQSWMNMDDPMAHLQNLSRATKKHPFNEGNMCGYVYYLCGYVTLFIMSFTQFLPMYPLVI